MRFTPISRRAARRPRRLLTSVLFLLAVAPAVWASELTVPHSFQANTPAVAVEVNANFGAVETAVDDNHSRIAALEAALAAQQATIANLQSALAAVQGNSVLTLDGKLGLGTENGYATARFTGVNVQIVNGLGGTGTINGLGNLTIGYNEQLAGQLEFCSDGAFDNQTACEENGAIWASNQRTGSHNLVLGRANAYSQYGGLIAGEVNIINGRYASVSAGIFNMASGDLASVSGGRENTARGHYASVSGGRNNIAYGDYTSVSGGQENFAPGDYASVSGGHSNKAIGDFASVSGGQGNWVYGDYASISGGNVSVVTGIHDWVAGSLFEDE